MKLHELIAVVGTLKDQATKTKAELVDTFGKKRHLFGRKKVTFQPSAEGKPDVVEEQSDIQSTVMKELKWIAEIWIPVLDTEARVAAANQIAKADVVLEGSTAPILTGVPVTALLELEKRVGELMDLANAIPTLDPAKGFTFNASENVYEAREVVKTRTQKTQRPIVLYDATPEHPAQTQLISEDVEIGKTHSQEWSGMITTADKGDMLARCEALRVAIKKARSRANETEIPDRVDVGKILFNHVFGLGLK